MMAVGTTRTLKRAGTALVAVWASVTILTSGPRSVLGHESPPGPVDPFDDPEVMWDVLAGLDFRTGEMSDELAQFVGEKVKVPGFMLPLEDWAQSASEFLLVPYVGACVHTPPPPPNQLVYVAMEENRSVPVSMWDPVWIHGILEVEDTQNIFGSVAFRLTGIEVKPYEW